MTWLRSTFIIHVANVAAVLSLGTVSNASAGKFDLAAGGFQITSKTARTETKISNVGAYRLGYFHPVLTHFEIGIAYNLVMSAGIGGDLGYGLDIGARYFPFSANNRVQWNSADYSYGFDDIWRPYIGLSFNQRQFQSIQAGYAGFGGDIGCERSLRGALSAKAELRYLRLTGPSQGSVTEIDGYAGISVAF
jgi:hypothetical protein